MDHDKRSFDPCVLVVLISIRLSPTVRITYFLWRKLAATKITIMMLMSFMSSLVYSPLFRKGPFLSKKTESVEVFIATLLSTRFLESRDFCQSLPNGVAKDNKTD